MLHEKLLLIVCIALRRRKVIQMIDSLRAADANYSYLLLFIDTNWGPVITFCSALHPGCLFCPLRALSIHETCVFRGMQRNGINWAPSNNKWNKINWQKWILPFIFIAGLVLALLFATHSCSSLRWSVESLIFTKPETMVDFPLACFAFLRFA